MKKLQKNINKYLMLFSNLKVFFKKKLKEFNIISFIVYFIVQLVKFGFFIILMKKDKNLFFNENNIMFILYQFKIMDK